jgi:hypothetical protein
LLHLNADLSGAAAHSALCRSLPLARSARVGGNTESKLLNYHIRGLQFVIQREVQPCVIVIQTCTDQAYTAIAAMSQLVKLPQHDNQRQAKHTSGDTGCALAKSHLWAEPESPVHQPQRSQQHYSKQQQRVQPLHVRCLCLRLRFWLRLRLRLWLWLWA